MPEETEQVENVFKQCEVSEPFQVCGRDYVFKYLSVGEQEWVAQRMNALGMPMVAHGVGILRRVHELTIAIKKIDYEEFGIDIYDFEEDDLVPKLLWLRKLDSVLFDYIYDAYGKFCTDHALKLVRAYREKEELTWPGIPYDQAVEKNDG